MQAEVIYKGATRPAMKAGVPLTALVALLGGTALVVLWVGTLVSWWVLPGVMAGVLPVLLALRHITRRDDQRLHQWVLTLRLRLRDRNHGFWRARSYAAYPYRRAP
ncbi:type IV secretion system protein VirB3 [Rubrivivax albus]|uniref:Type VI secretion protein n=1 Tax=Rubrivivax albus TaxID=2499835 RepID=A0A3S2TQ62_9BURK|nr:VirB3 family type IV secretion system protein [Rubrivivax albus]RVT50764.1 type VI secretion protein [Rubrivivax albus]